MRSTRSAPRAAPAAAVVSAALPAGVPARASAGAAATPAVHISTTTDDARARLLAAGLQLFAQQGYSQTSTRELAEAASVNVAAISYYFGDKAGLYRAVFFEPMGEAQDDIARVNAPALDLAGVLHAFFEVFLAPLRDGDAARLCMKLRFREMLEPTGLWDEEVSKGIKPLHDALASQIARRMGLARADEEIDRLTISLAGLGVHVHVGRDITDQLNPRLNAGPQAVDNWVASLTRYGLAMVRAEAERRGIALNGDVL